MNPRSAFALLCTATIAVGLYSPSNTPTQESREGTHLSSSRSEAPWPPAATFSILGYDPETGELGGAVQSRVFSVGNGVLWAEANIGVVATQAVVDVSYGPQALELLRSGMAPGQVVETILRNCFKRKLFPPPVAGNQCWEKTPPGRRPSSGTPILTRTHCFRKVLYGFFCDFGGSSPGGVFSHQ